MKSNNKIVGITMGDPGGIGPEVLVKALRALSADQRSRFVIIGDHSLFRRYGGKDKDYRSFVHIREEDPGRASLLYLKAAVHLLKKKEIASLVTAPVCKRAIAGTDPSFVGHTEFLAKAFDVKNVGMFFIGAEIRVMLVTRHIPLSQVSRVLSVENIYRAICLTHEALKKMFGIERPVIAVCGLNPHAGENGTMGKEEGAIIAPAIQRARQRRMDARGPFAADTLFVPSVAKDYDAVIAMYHDQGLIPVKTLGFERLVNLTVGLPFVRTSPAHGTAFNIAGKNKANPGSMRAAIELNLHILN